MLQLLTIHEKDIHHYVDRLKNNQPFAFVGYSDAEWYCMFGVRKGTYTGLGQLIDVDHGKLLLDILKRRQSNPNFLFAIPKILRELPYFQRNMMERFLRFHEVKIEGYERDMVLDDLARDGGLLPLIQQLRSMPLTIIGNWRLNNKKLENILRWNRFIGVSSPNHHITPHDFQKTRIEHTIRWVMENPLPGVYCVSAGVSAAVIIDKLYNKIPGAFFIDCGSIWDAFVGIGEQRQWRADLYSNPIKWQEWIRKNTTGE